MRVDFIATVSHELRTPLASLAGFIDTIAGPARNDAAARERFLGIMRDQAGRMTRLVDDLLQLSRVELNEHLPPTDAVDLGALVAHMAEIMAPLARERGVSIRLDIAKDLPNVRGDRDQLLRVAENLIENAMKYAGRGDVVVRVRQEEGRAVALSVADQGPGIAPEHIPRLTERFYRVDEAESRARGGTGLGLAIVKHVVGRHRGRLSIESELGKGTTVRIQLPAFEAPAA
jgi:two-component system phosphate regulon sensor histidine kinase PhoR